MYEWFRRKLYARPARADLPAAVAPSDLLTDLGALLGRPAVKLDTPEIQRFLAGKRVLVTGAGGSIGSELCRQIVRFCPKKLVLLDRSEYGLFEIHRELKAAWVGSSVKPVVADVCDAERVKNVLAAERPQVVFHAAAHKHVGLMEQNPGEAVKVNVLGTKHLADAAVRVGASAFVFVSTDKAVNPTSVMGATKRAAEMTVQDVAAQHLGRTRFCCVRFGNVLGSSGSVVPIFAKQIAAGGPVTVTHPLMERYLMTIPEAAGLIMQAGATADGGEVFVLDMGEPVKILHLARLMINRAGLEVGRDIAIRFTGVQPGEKLSEELANAAQSTRPTRNPKIHVWDLPPVSSGEVRTILSRLAEAVDLPEAVVRSSLAASVPEYQPAGHQPTLRLAA